MKRHFSNVWMLVGIGAIGVIASFLASYITGKWHWFGRSGAILTTTGVLLSVRPLIRMGIAEWLKSQAVINGGHASPTPEEIVEKEQTRLDAIASQCGVIMALLGTVIWAYGDLIGGLPQ